MFSCISDKVYWCDYFLPLLGVPTCGRFVLTLFKSVSAVIKKKRKVEIKKKANEYYLIYLHVAFA
jgi:hypothetical protein